VLHNTDATIAHPAFFTATGGGVGTPTFAIDIPDRTAFRTLLKTPVCASEFDGLAVVMATEAHLPPPAPPVGFELGIKLIVPTEPVQIDIGGWQIGVGGSIGVAFGPFVVRSRSICRREVER
jgi:hypothetical protein